MITKRMVRQELRRKENARETFTGTFERLGKKRAYRGPDLITILLRNVRDTECNPVADHLWFNMTKEFEALGELHEGDVIRFDARVTAYEKGYRGRREDVYRPVERDYRLSRPTRIERIDSSYDHKPNDIERR